jgi:hypothetical protein
MVYPLAVPLAGANEKRPIGLKRPEEGRQVVLRGSRQEAVAPAPDRNLVHSDPGLHNLPDRTAVGHLGQVVAHSRALVRGPLAYRSGC